jgi:light-regulated signal transduction histidine kinase (bacteriophytochrome)
MPIILDVQKPSGLLRLSSSTAPASDETPLPAELDTGILERTAQLERLNQELEAFSWSVCHDVSAPLIQIHSYLRFLKGHPGANLDNVARGYLAGIQNCADRMSRVTQDLLRLARIARTQLVRHRVDLSQMASGIAADLSARSPARQVKWLIATGLEAEADQGLIEILLGNLLSNAWKYTTPCSLAQIEFGALPQSEGPVQFHVQDNGVGFDMGSANRLFQPFERLHTEDEFPGAGIGLATARRIVQRHGGRIWAEGEVGRGALFRFTLGSL